MWGVTDESSENPLAELWGLFKRDDDVSWQHGLEGMVRPVRTLKL